MYTLKKLRSLLITPTEVTERNTKIIQWVNLYTNYIFLYVNKTPIENYSTTYLRILYHIINFNILTTFNIYLQLYNYS